MTPGIPVGISNISLLQGQARFHSHTSTRTTAAAAANAFLFFSATAGLLLPRALGVEPLPLLLPPLPRGPPPAGGGPLRSLEPLSARAGLPPLPTLGCGPLVCMPCHSAALSLGPTATAPPGGPRLDRVPGGFRAEAGPPGAPAVYNTEATAERPTQHMGHAR